MPDTPLYRIQVVSAITGVPAATLRAWERRYGFPKPKRAHNAYRLYSESDVRLIRYMARLCAEGTPPSDAAALVKADRRAEGGPVYEPRPEVSWASDTNTQLIDELVEAARRLDETALRCALDRALTTGAALDVYRQILVPALERLGGAHPRRPIGEAQFAAQAILTTARNLARLVQPDDSAHRLLLACVEHDPDELPLWGLALAAARRGWRSVVIGARSPPEAIVAARAVVAPDAIGLSAAGAPEFPDVAAYGRAHAGLAWFLWGVAEDTVHAVQLAGGGVVSRLEAMRGFLDPIDRGRPFRPRGLG